MILPSCFSQASTQTALTHIQQQGHHGLIPGNYILPHRIHLKNQATRYFLRKKAFENIAQREENVSNQHFLLFLPSVRPFGWLVVLRFKAFLTAKVISWRLVMHMCFLAFLHQYERLSFQSHQLLFCRGERRKYTGKKSCLKRVNSQPPGHESDTLTTEQHGRGICKTIFNPLPHNDTF